MNSGLSFKKPENAYGWKTRKVNTAVKPVTEIKVSREAAPLATLFWSSLLYGGFRNIFRAKATTGDMRTIKEPVNFDEAANPQNNPITIACLKAPVL